MFDNPPTVWLWGRTGCSSPSSKELHTPAFGYISTCILNVVDVIVQCAVRFPHLPVWYWATVSKCKFQQFFPKKKTASQNLLQKTWFSKFKTIFEGCLSSWMKVLSVMNRMKRNSCREIIKMTDFLHFLQQPLIVFCDKSSRFTFGTGSLFFTLPTWDQYYKHNLMVTQLL